MSERVTTQAEEDEARTQTAKGVFGGIVANMTPSIMRVAFDQATEVAARGGPDNRGAYFDDAYDDEPPSLFVEVLPREDTVNFSTAESGPHTLSYREALGMLTAAEEAAQQAGPAIPRPRGPVD